MAPLARVVARDRVCVGHDEVLDAERVARGRAEPEHVPDVVERRAHRRQEHRAPLVRAVGAPARRAVGLVDRAVGAEPRGVPAAAREAPPAADPVAAVRRDRARARPRPPDEDRARIVAEDLARHVRAQVGRDHRAPRRLAEAPRRARVGLCDRLDDLHERDGIDLGAAERGGEQEAEQPGVVERRDDRLGEPALPVGLVRGRGDRGRQAPRRLQIPAHRGRGLARRGGATS